MHASFLARRRSPALAHALVGRWVPVAVAVLFVLQWAVVPISHWFDKRRGKAQSYLIVGGTLITSVLWFPIFERLIEAYGWRVAMRCCAVALVAVALPAAILVWFDLGVFVVVVLLFCC